MENGKKISASAANNKDSFQMPVHYPRYTKKDYQDMPEWMLDRLLAAYGLAAQGDVAFKREFAMGAFLWPPHDKVSAQQLHSCPGGARSSYYTTHETPLQSALRKKNI